MKLIRSIFIVFLVTTFFSSKALKAGSSASLFLRTFVPPTISTSIKESQINSNQSLWLIKSQSNAQFPLEGQKYEVEGLDQAGMEAHIKKVTEKDSTIQYEILISRLKYSMKNDTVIFLKISAN